MDGSNAKNPFPQDFDTVSSGTYGEQALRRKTWEEQPLEGRIELLRQQLRSKDFALREIREQLNVLMQHSHGPTGELLAPLLSRFASNLGSSFDPLA